MTDLDRASPGVPDDVGTAERPTSGSRAVMVSTASQLGARGLHLLLNAVSTLALLRYLGPDRYGGFVQVITVAAIGGLISDMGLNKLGVREISREPSAERDVVGSALAARLGMGVGAVVLTLRIADDVRRVPRDRRRLA